MWLNALSTNSVGGISLPAVPVPFIDLVCGQLQLQSELLAQLSVPVRSLLVLFLEHEVNPRVLSELPVLCLALLLGRLLC